MHKWLVEIEIYASNTFGEVNCRQFVDETRPIVLGVCERLKRNVSSRYGKIGVYLYPKAASDEFSFPSHEYDTIGGVCVINCPYDLTIYLNENNVEMKKYIVFEILRDAFKNMPDEVGLDRELVIEILTNVYDNLKSR